MVAFIGSALEEKGSVGKILMNKLIKAFATSFVLWHQVEWCRGDQKVI